jgi:protein O-mannosyl-transferase
MGRRNSQSSKADAPDRPHRGWLVAAALALFTAAVYSRACFNGFVNFDDTFYGTDNYRVQSGLTLDNMRWAMTSLEHANWHPLTWLSLQLDATLFGHNSAGFHTTSVLLHVANTVILFWILYKATGALAASAVTAALFALHPLHVESVAWVSERKDVLSGCFWLLTMAGYGRYVEQKSLRWYGITVALFALGLCAKPMVVTLPFVLLLWDSWPLRRRSDKKERETERGGEGKTVKFASSRSRSRPVSHSGTKLKTATGPLDLVTEKAPLFLLAAASCVITYVAQQRTGAIRSSDALSFGDRLAHVPLAYIEYLAKTVWPRNLAVYYPYSHSRRSIELALLATAVLAIMTIWIIRRRDRQPYLAVGWFWFIGTLVPTIGLVQVGGQALADRYTYIPLIGIFIAVVWGIVEIAVRGQFARALVVMPTIIGLALLAIATFTQIGYWHDSITLWQHARQVSGDGPYILGSLGDALVSAGRTEDALPLLEAAADKIASDSSTHMSLGSALFRLGRYAESEMQFEEAMRLNAHDDKAAYNLGCVWLAQGKAGKAIEAFEQSLRLNPFFWRPELALAELLAKQGAAAEAQYHFQRALQIDRQASLAAWRNSHPDAPDAAALAAKVAGSRSSHE